MRPERFKDSDAAFNFGGAVGATACVSPGRVAVCMGGRVVDAEFATRGPGGHFQDTRDSK
jgi:hypothetical protein